MRTGFALSSLSVILCGVIAMITASLLWIALMAVSACGVVMFDLALHRRGR